ncbi:hypothetical protein YC2023_104649 [Brassica napus]
MTGEITIAQKRKSKETCRQNLENKDRTCEPKSCEAECVRRHKPGTGHCGQGTGKIPICIYEHSYFIKPSRILGQKISDFGRATWQNNQYTMFIKFRLL